MNCRADGHVHILKELWVNKYWIWLMGLAGHHPGRRGRGELETNLENNSIQTQILDMCHCGVDDIPKNGGYLSGVICL